MKNTATSLIDIVHWRVNNQPNKLLYRFLKDGEDDEVSITYEELDHRARSIGAMLQASTNPGDRALLLFPAGLDFIASFFGCLYAKVIAVPVSPPIPHPAYFEKTLANILRIVADAKPSAVLLNTFLFEAINSQKAIKDQIGSVKLLVTEMGKFNDQAENWEKPDIEGKELAYLQYTSGSTSEPKGVMVSHSNLLHNMSLIERIYGQNTESHAVSWMPHYHDMGLITGILQPLYTGASATLFPHFMFLQRPLRWLQAISRFNGTTGGGPNFAYDLCVRKVKPEQKEHLDLSSWSLAFNGAEQVHHKTLDQFTEYFASCGFRREAFSSCYGLAESTVMVVGALQNKPPAIKNLVKSGLEENKVIISPEDTKDTKTVVSVGQNIDIQKIRIVNVETLTPCLPDEIGEIWLSGPSVAMGYWEKPLESASTFGARLSNTEEGPFLRTGDLGFFHDEELFITGRLKNLIIIDGKNIYPYDIERTVGTCHPAIRQGRSAVFSIENSERERVVVIAEVKANLIENNTEVNKAIRKAIAENHDLPVYDIKLCQPGEIPLTTSGKIRHFLCKKSYISGTLKEITLP